MNPSNAAHNLEGRILKNGWLVLEKIEKKHNATGQFFSVCYKVKKNSELCFLKAFDFNKFFNLRNEDESLVDVMSIMLNSFKYERDISELCRDKHVTKVVIVKDSGEETIEGFTIPVVPYLIFDMADGDIRKNIDFSKNLDYAWLLKSLHEISIGLKQLHKLNISHQDIKPSNILVFGDEFKIGDLGRSMCKYFYAPHHKNSFSGDWTYAPPEMLYGYYEKDWNNRTKATDCYLLGSLVVFYFTGINMTALMNKNIHRDFWWDKFEGSFSEVKPYLLKAFSKSLQEFEDSINFDHLKYELRNIVQYLCYPIPEERGHPKDISAIGSNYSLERFVSKFDRLSKTHLYHFIKGK